MAKKIDVVNRERRTSAELSRMPRRTDLSIIIVSYSTRQLIDKCLETIFRSLKNTQLNYEVIVVDNASTDNSREMINKKYPRVKLLTNKINTGYGRANNQGVTAAKGDVILFLNSDTEVINGAIEKLLNFFRSLSEKAVVGGKLFNADGTAQSSCGPAYNLTNIFTALLLKGDQRQVTRYSPDTTKKIDWVMGACMMMRRQAFVEVGGFDENIFMYMDEIDWQYRAQKLRYQIYFYPEAHFIHVGAASSEGRATPILNIYRGFIYHYEKHFNNYKKYLLRAILLLKAIMAIGLFTLLNKKTDRKLYIEALKIAVS